MQKFQPIAARKNCEHFFSKILNKKSKSHKIIQHSPHYFVDITVKSKLQKKLSANLRNFSKKIAIWKQYTMPLTEINFKWNYSKLKHIKPIKTISNSTHL